MMELENLVRKNIKQMKAYSSARHEFTGDASIFLDANENAFGSPGTVAYNRYPDPLQSALKKKIAELKSVIPERIFLGNGSDEAIDLLFRIFCEPAIDNVIYCPPTYGMYEVCAAMNDISIRPVSLNADFQVDVGTVLATVDEHTKLIFICSPNNPTGNCMHKADVETILEKFNGLVIVDEAYIDYAEKASFLEDLNKFNNLVVLQTFSKAWGLAALRLGMAFAGEEIIQYMNKVKYPYNVNAATQEIVIKSLEETETVKGWIRKTIAQRKILSDELYRISTVEKVYPSDANFILVKIKNAHGLYRYLTDQGIIVRDRSRVLLCEDCLRITIGTPEENKQLLAAIKDFR
jgi:histidinol-phosphate aminotransferase